VRFLVGLLPNLLDCCRTSSAPGYHLGPRRTAAERAQYALIAGGIMLALSVLGLLWYRGEYQSEKAAGSPTAQPSRPRCPSSDHLRQVWPNWKRGCGASVEQVKRLFWRASSVLIEWSVV